MSGTTKENFKQAWGLIKDVFANFGENRSGIGAAALAYYGIFAIFPLLLFVIFIGGQFLQTSDARQLLDTTMESIMPFVMDDINAIIDQTLESTNSSGIIGVLGLIWSGSAVFNVLVSSLSEIWGADPHPYWRRRIMAAVSVLFLGIAFTASFFILPIISWVGSALKVDSFSFYTPLFETVLALLTIYLLFRVFPNKSVNKKAAFYGALVGTFLIEAAKYGFLAYLGTVIERYGSIYGSIAWVVALGIWAYLVGILFFLSAEFGAEFERRLSNPAS